MSRYGLRTSIESEQIVEFLRKTPAPRRDVDFFLDIPWTRKLFDGAKCPYESAPFYSRYYKSNSQDLFFAQTIASDDTVPHMLFLLRKEGWGNPQHDLPTDGKQRPFTAPAVPDAVLLVDLKKGFNGFADMAHGGAMCALIDETLGMTAELHRETASSTKVTTLFTANMSVNFLAPVMTPDVLAIRAWLHGSEGRKWFLRAQVVDGKGTVLIETDSIWISARPKSNL